MYAQYALFVLGNESSILLCSFQKLSQNVCVCLFLLSLIRWHHAVPLLCLLRIIFYSLILSNTSTVFLILLYCILWYCGSMTGLYMLHVDSSSEPHLQSRSYAKHYLFYKVCCFRHWITTFSKNLKVKRRKDCLSWFISAFYKTYFLSTQLVLFKIYDSLQKWIFKN